MRKYNVIDATILTLKILRILFKENLPDDQRARNSLKCLEQLLKVGRAEIGNHLSHPPEFGNEKSMRLSALASYPTIPYSVSPLSSPHYDLLLLLLLF